MSEFARKKNEVNQEVIVIDDDNSGPSVESSTDGDRSIGYRSIGCSMMFVGGTCFVRRGRNDARPTLEDEPDGPPEISLNNLPPRYGTLLSVPLKKRCTKTELVSGMLCFTDRRYSCTIDARAKVYSEDVHSLGEEALDIARAANPDGVRGRECFGTTPGGKFLC